MGDPGFFHFVSIAEKSSFIPCREIRYGPPVYQRDRCDLLCDTSICISKIQKSFNRIYQVFVTLGLAFLTTLFGAIIVGLFGLLAAENLSSKRVLVMIKGIVAFIRAVPTVLWVLIFAFAAGLGSPAAVIGVTFHSITYIIS